jgi:hypothetical protein
MTGTRKRVAVLAVAAAVVVAGVATTAAVALASGAPNVTTAGYDTLRTNWDPNESALSPAAVQASTFGKVFTTKVKGQIYAQPLVINNTVIVTTEKANAYGINATTGAIEWTRNFGTPFKASTIVCSDLTPDVGSTSTPVVDPATGTVYLTTRLQSGGGIANSHWYLQALSSSTGKEVSGFPVEIQGTPDNTPGVPFDADYAMQRPGLLLLNGAVYMGFASDCDITPYRGIVVGVSTSTAKVTTMWSDESGIGTDADSQAGIWQSGGGLVSDIAGRIILATGNGVSPTPAAGTQPPATLSESVVALSVGTNGKLTPTQFFSPSNAPTLDQNDTDLGSGGPVALPTAYFGTSAHPHLVVEVGKDGRIFLIDADHMGGSGQGAGGGDSVLQTLGPFNGVWGHPAVYGGQGGWVYILESSGGGYLRALSYGTNGQGVPQLTSQGTSTGSFGYTSGSPMVTSNGTTAGSAVVWVVYAGGSTGAKAQLRAYGAAPSGGVLPLLWSAPIGTASKFSMPTAYNGRIYVGDRQGRLMAFGSSAGAPVQAAPVDFGQVAVGQTKTVTVSAAITQNLQTTGPVSVDGVQEEAGPSTTSSLRGTTRRVESTTVPASGVESSSPVAGSAPIPPGQVFTVTGAPPTSSKLKAGTTLRVKVTFSPTVAGPVVAQVNLPTSSGVHTVAVSGYGTVPGLLASARPLTFGTIATGAGGEYLSVTISNSGSQSEKLTSVDLPGAPYSVTGLPAVGTELAPQEAFTVSVHFDPSVGGVFPPVLSLHTDQGSISLPVSGSAESGHPLLVLSTRSVSFGTVGVGSSETLSFDVSNGGTVPLTIERVIVPEGAFSTTVPLPQGLRLDPDTTVHQTVTFSPTRPGPATGSFSVTGNDEQGPQLVSLSGSGT